MREGFIYETPVSHTWNYPRAFANYVVWEGRLHELKRSKEEIIFSKEDYKIIFQEIASRLYALFYLKEFGEMNFIIPSQKLVAFEAGSKRHFVLDLYRNQNKDFLERNRQIPIIPKMPKEFSKLTLWDICVGITSFVCDGALCALTEEPIVFNEACFETVLKDFYNRFNCLYELEKAGKNLAFEGIVEEYFKGSSVTTFSLEACEKVCPKIKDFFLAR